MHRLQCSRLCILLICLSNGLGSVIAQFNNESTVERRACLILTRVGEKLVKSWSLNAKYDNSC